MPRDFTGSVDSASPVDLPGTNMGPVNPLEGMDDTAALLDEGLTGYILGEYEQNLTGEPEGTDAFLYDKSRELKNQVIEAGKSGNQEAVNGYLRELQKLKIAERQGALGPSAASTRGDATTREYINRFPHLAAEIKKVYAQSSGGGASGGGSSREQFKDPVESAQDDLIAEWQKTAPLMDLQEFMQVKTEAKDIEMESSRIALQEKLGTAFEVDTNKLATNFSRLALRDLDNVTYTAVKQAEDSGAFDAASVKNLMLGARDNAVLNLEAQMQDALQRQSTSGRRPLLSSTYVQRKKDELAKMYDDRIAAVQDLDQLKTWERNNKLLVLNGVKNIGKLSEYAGFLGTLDPASLPTFINGAFKEAFDQNAAGMLDRYAATSGGDSAITDAISIVESMPPETGFVAFMDMVVKGQYSRQTSSPVANATINKGATDAALRDPKVSPEHKATVAEVSLREEKRETGRAQAGPQWYKDPAKRAQLQTNPTIKREVRQDSANSVVSFANEIKQSGWGDGLNYSPQADIDGEKPWDFYPSGGPFSIGATGRSRGASGVVAQRQGLVEKLNRGYFLERYAAGPDAADKWARDVVSKMQTGATEEPINTSVPGIIDYNSLPKGTQEIDLSEEDLP